MKNKYKRMINEDIEQCKKMLNDSNSRDFYRAMYQKYKTFDEDLCISEKAKVLNGSELNFSYEINQLIGKLEAYLLLDDFLKVDNKKAPVKIKINNKYGNIGNNNSNFVDKKTNIETNLSFEKKDDKKHGFFSRIFGKRSK